MLEVLILRYISLTIILCIFEGFRVRMVAMKVPLSGKGMAPSKEFINLITFLTEEMVRYLKKNASGTFRAFMSLLSFCQRFACIYI